ncbi:MAG TPA: hypothetical protein VFD72_06180, partial [Sphingobacteriaceae bacterium]|nr:hypothetical protein [Sphingobacteriaceae bacterium]
MKSTRFVNLLLLVFLAVLLAYANHFENGFHFDDTHTITNNPAIEKLDVVTFFKDGSTFSSLPSNQSYRPWITTINALDYQVLGGLYPGPFHVHIFLTFLITIGLLVYLVRKILRQHASSIPHLEQDRLALITGAVFGLLCANAETVNYIIQRAEIEAGLFILAGFVAFLQGGIWRKWHLYMIFPVLGFFAKELAFTFAPLLLIYFLIFEQKVDLLRFYRAEELPKVWRAVRQSLPAFAITLVFGLIYAQMLPETFSTGSSDRWAYLMTQPFVIGHYVLTFFIPYNLSADTDWTTFTSLADYRVWIGIFVVLLLIWLALKTSSHPDTRMVSFGLIWFLITLAPTSSIIPLAEVLNDHRAFIPYMGLTMAVVFGVRYVLIRYFSGQYRQPGTQKILWGLLFLVLAANAYGVHERNKVWRNDLSLWKDVTEKSPGNGRGFMNYGLALMARGEFAAAEENFLQAQSRNPDYSLVYINLGILKNAMGEASTAETYFKQALNTSTSGFQSHYYYGKFLSESGRVEEAKAQLEQALILNPHDHQSRQLLHDLEQGIPPAEESTGGLRTADDYLALSLAM